MKVKDVLDITDLSKVVVEVHWHEKRFMFGGMIDCFVTKTSMYDDLSPYGDRVVKYVHCHRTLAYIYSLISHALYGTEPKQDPIRIIQLYV